MRWNVPNTAVGRIFLVAIALDDDAALPRARGGRAEPVSRTWRAVSLPFRGAPASLAVARCGANGVLNRG